MQPSGGTPSSSERDEVWASHPPCVGVKAKSGDFATKALSAHPWPLNQIIAGIIKDSRGRMWTTSYNL